MIRWVAVVLLALPMMASAGSFEPVLGKRSLISGFAGSGLIQTPTARLVEGGEISLFNMRSAPYRHMGLVLGVHPRVEATIRYSDVEDVAYGFGRNQGYKDKGLNVRVLVAREDLWRPAIAVGIHDLGGTNLFSGEYVVASKRLGRFDASLGVGWGRVGAEVDLPTHFLNSVIVLIPGTVNRIRVARSPLATSSLVPRWDCLAVCPIRPISKG